MVSNFWGQLLAVGRPRLARDGRDERLEPTLGRADNDQHYDSRPPMEPTIGFNAAQRSVAGMTVKHPSDRVLSPAGFEQAMSRPRYADAPSYDHADVAAARDVSIEVNEADATYQQFKALTEKYRVQPKPGQPVAAMGPEESAPPVRQIEPVDDPSEIDRIKSAVLETADPSFKPAPGTDFSISDPQTLEDCYDALPPVPNFEPHDEATSTQQYAQGGRAHQSDPLRPVDRRHETQTARPLSQFAPISDSTKDQGVFVETRSVNKAPMFGQRSAKQLMLLLTLVGVLGLGGAVSYAAFSVFETQKQVPTIVHDLAGEKVIPPAHERGGHQVPNLGLQVLERGAGGHYQFTTTRAVAAPEQPNLMLQEQFAETQVPEQAPVLDDVANEPIELGLAETLAQLQQQSVSDDRTMANTQQVVRATIESTEDLSAPLSLTPLFEALALNNSSSAQTLAGADPLGGLIDAGAAVVANHDQTASSPILTPGAAIFQQVINPWGLQLAASNSPDSARRLWQNVRQSNIRAFASLNHQIQPVTRNGQVLYRLRVGPFQSRSAALNTCYEMQQAYGQVGCFPVTTGM